MKLRNEFANTIISWFTINRLVVLLLFGILLTQVAILARTPTRTPTLGDLMDAKTDSEQELLYKKAPVVRILGGRVEISGTVDVNVENSPLEVEISR